MRNILLSLLIVIGSAPCLGADVYPSKPVRIIATFGPGSTDDLVARLMSQQLSEQMGRTFVVENRTGATGTLGNGFVAKSAPDGYTLLVADTTWTLTPSLYKSLQYDVARDFTPITQVIRVPQALVVPPALKVSTLREFIALLQANPGKFNYGSSGPGSAVHLFSELFKKAAKVNMANVPFSGGAAEAMTAVLGNQVEMLITSIATVYPHVAGGRLRALAVTTDGERAPSMPEVPSMSEAGLPDMKGVYVWFGFAGPAGLPRDIVSRLHTEVVNALRVPAVRDRFIAQGAELVSRNPEEFAAHIRSELRRWGEVAKATGITLD